MLSGLRANIIDDRHKFKTVAADVPLPKRRKLTLDYFQADAEKESLPFNEISNLEQKPDYYSPKSENNSVQMGG